MRSIATFVLFANSVLGAFTFAGVCPPGYSLVGANVYRDTSGTNWVNRRDNNVGKWYRWKYVMQFNGKSLLEHPTQSSYRVWIPSTELASFTGRACGQTAHGAQVYDPAGNLFQCWDGSWRFVGRQSTAVNHNGFPPPANPYIWRHPTKWYDAKWRSNHTNYIPDEELNPTEYNRVYSNPFPGSDFGYPR